RAFESETGRGQRLIYRNRIQFARQALVDAGLIVPSTDERWERGKWLLSPAGEDLARSSATDDAILEIVTSRVAEVTKQRRIEREESRRLAGIDSSSGDDSDDEEEVAVEAQGSVVVQLARGTGRSPPDIV